MIFAIRVPAGFLETMVIFPTNRAHKDSGGSLYHRVKPNLDDGIVLVIGFDNGKIFDKEESVSDGLQIISQSDCLRDIGDFIRFFPECIDEFDYVLVPRIYPKERIL